MNDTHTSILSVSGWLVVVGVGRASYHKNLISVTELCFSYFSGLVRIIASIGLTQVAEPVGECLC